MGFQRLAHPQHAGGAVGHLQGDAQAHGRGQLLEDGLFPPGKAAQGLRGAGGKLIGQRAAADKGRRSQPHAAKQGTHRPGRALGKDGEPPAPAGKQLHYIPQHLGQTAIGIQQQVVQIAEHEGILEVVIHAFPS